jgi:hypothetical protein
MSLVKQYSRIAHHTLVGLTGSTFSIPASSDFTDGTWTSYDLYLSEFGVNEADKKLYIRIDDEIKEIAFAATGSAAGTLEETLALGNTMGTYSIYMNNGKLFSTNGTSSFAMSDSSTINLTPQQEFNKLNYTFGYNEIKTMRENTTSGTASSTIFTITNAQLPTESVCKVILSTQAIDPTNFLYYSNEMFAFFYSNGGTVSLLGTVDENQKTNMAGGGSVISTDGIDINISVSGDAGSSIYWASTITYRISTGI